MLHITGSMKTLREELRVADKIINNVINVLGNLKPQANLTAQVGYFLTHDVFEIEFKVLARDVESAKHLLRKVCSGEVNPNDAHFRFVSAQQELHRIQNMLDSVDL